METVTIEEVVKQMLFYYGAKVTRCSVKERSKEDESYEAEKSCEREEGDETEEGDHDKAEKPYVEEEAQIDFSEVNVKELGDFLGDSLEVYEELIEESYGPLLYMGPFYTDFGAFRIVIIKAAKEKKISDKFVYLYKVIEYCWKYGLDDPCEVINFFMKEEVDPDNEEYLYEDLYKVIRSALGDNNTWLLEEFVNRGDYEVLKGIIDYETYSDDADYKMCVCNALFNLKVDVIKISE